MRTAAHTHATLHLWVNLNPNLTLNLILTLTLILHTMHLCYPARIFCQVNKHGFLVRLRGVADLTPTMCASLCCFVSCLHIRKWLYSINSGIAHLALLAPTLFAATMGFCVLLRPALLHATVHALYINMHGFPLRCMLLLCCAAACCMLHATVHALDINMHSFSLRL